MVLSKAIPKSIFVPCTHIADSIRLAVLSMLTFVILFSCPGPCYWPESPHFDLLSPLLCQLFDEDGPVLTLCIFPCLCCMTDQQQASFSEYLEVQTFIKMYVYDK